MASTDNLPPARLLRGLARTRNPAVWGFPFDSSTVVANYGKTSPPPDIGYKGIAEYITKVSRKLRYECDELWQSPGMIPTPLSVRPSPRKSSIIIAFIRATRPDDSFLPPPEMVEQMKAIFAAEGFMEEPGWFIEG